MSAGNETIVSHHVELEQEQQLDDTTTIDMLDQSQLEGAVIVYDNNSQEVVKLVTAIDSSSLDNVENGDDINNLITLHASSDSKDENLEENISLNIMEESNVNLNLSIQAEEEAEEMKMEQQEQKKVDEDEAEDDDDETIATFVTSDGREMALYAVESSDQLFAVALFNESGEPPTNFEFIMKDEVERLIEQGAIRTRKKKLVQPVKLKESQSIQKTDDSTDELIATLESKPDSPQESSTTVQKQDSQQKEKTPPKQVTEVVSSEVVSSSPVEHVSPEKQVSPVKQSSPNKPLSPVTQSSPTKQVSPVKQLSPTKQVSPVKQSSQPKTTTSPLKQGTSVKPDSSPKQVHETKTTSPIKLVSMHNPKSLLEPLSPRMSPSMGCSSSPLNNMEKKATSPTPEALIKRIMEPKKIQKTKPIIKRTHNVVDNRKFGSVKRQVTNKKNNMSSMQINNSIAFIVTEKNEAYIIDRPQEIDSDTEILEESTVQYILGDGHSDDELTFEELQRSVQSFDKFVDKSSNKTDSSINTKPTEINLQKTSTPIARKCPKIAPILSQRRSSVASNSTTITTPVITKTPLIYKTYSNVRKNNNVQATIKVKKELEDTLIDDYEEFFIDGTNFISESETDTSRAEKSYVIASDGTSNLSKVKRSRKQKLTMNNRPDTEIIIQQASVYSDEDSEPVVKKRGRKKKRFSPDPEYSPRKSFNKSKRLNHSYEIIEIDVDENDRSSLNDVNDVIDVTETGGTAKKNNKGSSDKENNDVISLGSSEENEDDNEDDDDANVDREFKRLTRSSQMVRRSVGRPSKSTTSSTIQCNNCSRNFVNLRSLTTHLHSCAKKSQTSFRKFKCKSCSESFDAAVTLARHVRITHSPKKRGRPFKKARWSSKDDMSESSTTELDDDEISISDDNSEPEQTFERKRRGRPPLKKKLNKETSLSKERSMSIELDDKNDEKSDKQKDLSKDNRSVSPDIEEIKDDEQIIAEIPKKRGRSLIKNTKRSASPESNTEANSSEIITKASKRGRRCKKILSQDERSSSVDKEDKIEEKNLNTESEKTKDDKTKELKKGEDQHQEEEEEEEAKRKELEKKEDQHTDKVSLAKDVESSLVENNDSKTKETNVSIDKTAETKKQNESAIEDSSETILTDIEKIVNSDTVVNSDSKKKDNDNNKIEKVNSDNALESQSLNESVENEKTKVPLETVEKEPTVMEKRSRRGRPPKDRSKIEAAVKKKLEISDAENEKKNKPNDESVVVEIKNADSEGEKDESNKQNPNISSIRTTRSNSSIDIVTTASQQKTTKLGKLVHRCLTCKRFVPVEMFSKHMEVAHNKIVTISSTPSTSTPTTSKRVTRNVASPSSEKRPNVRQLRSSN